MKKQYYFCLFIPLMLLAAVIGHAQRKEHYIEQNFSNDVLDLVATWDGGYLQANDIRQWIDTTSYEFLLTKFDAAGDTTWQKGVSIEVYMPYIDAIQLVPMPDGSTIILVYGREYDFGLAPIIMRIDTAGSTLWQKNVAFELSPEAILPKGSDSFYSVLYNNSAQQYDLNGLEIGDPVPWSASRLIVLSDGLLLANSTKVWKVNEEGIAVSDTFMLSPAIRSIDTLENGNILVSGGNQVYRLNSSFDVISNVYVATNAQSLRVAGCSDGFLAAQNSGDYTYLRRYNWSGNIVNSAQLGKLLEVKRLLTRDSFVAFAANVIYFSDHTASWTGFDNINTSGVWINGTDLELADVWVAGSATAVPNGTIFPNGPICYSGYFNDIYAKIINKGTTPINSWVIRFEKKDFLYEFNDILYAKRFEGYNLAPGDSIEVLAFPELIYSCVSTNSPILCLSASDVNHRRDDNYDNNLACDMVEQIVIVPVGEATIVEAKIYPNPTHSTVLCQLPADWKPASYQILNMMGQVVLNAAFTTPELDVSQLPEGAYQVRVVSQENALAIGRLVVLR